MEKGTGEECKEYERHNTFMSEILVAIKLSLGNFNLNEIISHLKCFEVDSVIYL